MLLTKRAARQRRYSSRRQGRIMREDLELETRALNDNQIEPLAIERRSFSDIDPKRAPAPPLSTAERTALGMLRCGRSFMEAAESSGVRVERVMALWKELTSRRG